MCIVFIDIQVSHEEAEIIACDHGGRLPNLGDPVFEGWGWYWLANANADATAGSKFFFLRNGKTGEVLADNQGFRAAVIIIVE